MQAGGTAMGLFGPGAGYGTGARAVVAHVDDAAQLVATKGDEAADALRTMTGMCFVAGTPVSVPGGEVPIESLEVGDEVLAAEPDGAVEVSRVVSRIFRTAPVVVDVEVWTRSGSSELTATEDHPFWVVGRGWVEA
ncbi:MAG: Hint domain-containing protein, partial [Myxococcota bacterium]